MYIDIYIDRYTVCWRFGVWDPGFKSCIQQRNTTCLLSIWISLACARASKLTNIYIYINMGLWTAMQFNSGGQMGNSPQWHICNIKSLHTFSLHLFKTIWADWKNETNDSPDTPLFEIDPDMQYHINVHYTDNVRNCYFEDGFNEKIKKLNKNNLSIFQLNAKHLQKYLDKFESYLNLLDIIFSFLRLTETWALFEYKDRLSRYAYFYYKVRRSWDRLIFIMGIPISVRGHLYIETYPWPTKDKNFTTNQIILV